MVNFRRLPKIGEKDHFGEPGLAFLIVAVGKESRTWVRPQK
jgi:hypothetical protein